MGKRRQTAKTGDKAVSKAPNDDEPKRKSKDDDDNDPMYNEVDRFHNSREEDFLKLDQTQEESEDDEHDQVEAVMDLGGGKSDEESSDSEDGSRSSKEGDDDDDDDSSDENAVSSSDEEEEMEEGDVRDWGKKKSDYYHGDTADLEIGQDEDDAYVEEEAAKEVQAAELKEMSEDDYNLSDDEDNEEDDRGGEKTGTLSSARDVSKLSVKEKARILDKQHPEMLPLLSHFSEVVEDLEERTMVATRAIFDGEENTAEAVGATKLGQQYLLTKALLQSSVALNLGMYLLLKEEQSSMRDEDDDTSLIQSHPVMSRLQKLNLVMGKLDERVESKVDGLGEQMENLVKASALLQSGTLEESGGEEEDASVDVEEDAEEDGTEESVLQDAGDEQSKEEDEESVDEEQLRRQAMNEARFGLRPNEVETGKVKRGRRSASALDFVDDVDEQAAPSKSLASTINAIAQRQGSRKRRAAPSTEQMDDPTEGDGELQRGLQMMEEELGKDWDDGNADDADDVVDDELDDGDNDFYAQVAKQSKSKKDFRKSLYKVAPKFPRVEKEIEGERAINRTILKNRGLVAHKAKINRNPRVKGREKFRKAVIRRKGAVRDVRTQEGHKYGGEETGVKSNLSRSRKLA